ncbi:MAG TPA: amidase [Acidimicrobiales bacterium]|nr:amidase [Acidimicrobiales bacterium]
MSDDDLAWVDATGQAQLVRDKEVTASELVEAAIGRIERTDPHIHAVIHPRFDKAIEEAKVGGLPDGPFTGVPFLVKDLSAPTAGDPQHNGMKALKEAGYIAPADSWLNARYRSAGFVFVGRTNTPELGLVPTTEPEAHGATHNPWSLDHTPGGSSGGSAAAVAAGMVPAAHASDGGGSIRIPASMCGLVGLKVSRGRITMGPDRDESALSVNHVVTRSVRDCAGILDATAGPGPGDMAMAPPPRRPYVEEVGADPGRLHIGLLAARPGDAGPVHANCEAAARHAASLLEGLGHHVEESHPAILDDAAVTGAFGARWCVNARMGLIGTGNVLGRELTADDVEPLTWAMAEIGRSVSGVDYAKGLAAGVQLTRGLGLWWAEGWDVLVTPTLGEPPPRLGAVSGPEGSARTGALVPFTTHFNVSGQPAISLPLWWNDEGLPIGVQLVADYGREDVLLRVAAQLEVAQPWADRRPPTPA